ncbi:MAG: electron transfer flavoprotein subunit beta/FixA family protein [Verrucomicrobiota bacterium]
MQTFVVMKLVPDTVEEMTVAADGKSLETEYLRLKLSDPDEHALEEALLLKERQGGSVTAVALDGPEVDDVLFTALAKGADRAVKLTGDVAGIRSRSAARVFGAFLTGEGKALPPDTLIFVCSQAIDDLDGELGPYLAELLGLPYVCVVTAVASREGKAVITKEFAGGWRGEIELPLPAVLGIQSAEKPPRYVPVAKVRAAMKTGRIETVEVTPPDQLGPLKLERMYKPEVTGGATMIEGSPEQAADQIVAVLSKSNLI